MGRTGSSTRSTVFRFVVPGVVAAVAVTAVFYGRDWFRSRSPRSPEPPPVAAPAPRSRTAPGRSPASAGVARRESPPTRPRRPPAPRPAETPPAPTPTEPAATATLHVESDVAGASVFLDREYVGTTPLTLSGVSIGGHRLNVSAAGYEGYAETIDVEPGERTITVRFKEVRLDAAIDVVHKHRFGSCRGRLVATPAGLRYEASDRDDAFSVSLDGLEVFEVDYLQKNLRLKPRGGKTYNFTDPEGNADRLFVFHRDVEKVRERLRSGRDERP